MRIVLGISGGIAAYKTPDLVRRLQDAGAAVRVILTPNAARFVTPLSLAAVSNHPVIVEQWGDASHGGVDHIERVKAHFVTRDLEGKSVLVTAGPTREAIDPVRYISNRSSGKMGYAIAEAARRRGANVTLVSGPVSISVPNGVALSRVTSAGE